MLQQLLAADSYNSDAFGTSLSISDGHAVIGAKNNNERATNAGAAYLFVRESDGQWRQHAKLTASDGQANDRFGSSVALDGDWAVIGAPYDDDLGFDSGSAYLFRVGPDWSGNGVPDLCECPGDVDYDGFIGLSDLAVLLSNYGATEGMHYADGDLTGDGAVGLGDLSALLGVFGTACP